MELKYLRNHHEDLLMYMKLRGYSEYYIGYIRCELNRVLALDKLGQWRGFEEYFNNSLVPRCAQATLENKRTVLSILEQFDQCYLYPDYFVRRTAVKKPTNFMKLKSREFIDLVSAFSETKQGCRSQKDGISIVAAFLLEMENQGIYKLDGIQEPVILEYVRKNENRLGATSRNKLKRFFERMGELGNLECLRIATCIPKVRRKRKNIQYLTDSEVNALKELIHSQKLNKRDSAILTLLIYTGLRRSDIAALTLNSLDFDNLRITLQQVKTENFLEIPMTPSVFKALSEYPESRPATVHSVLFLQENGTGKPITPNTVTNLISRVFKKCNIRQNTGDRQGSHIFRHHFVSELLADQTPLPVISQLLGHSSHNAIEHYLSADFKHLKEFALDIEEFPCEGVFE